MVLCSYYRIGMRIFVGIIACFISASNTLASDAPDVGLLYNTKESHSLVFQCKQSTKNILECDFTQIAVRKKAKAEDLKVSLSQARDEFRAGVKMTPEECKAYGELVEILEGRRMAPKEQEFKKISDIAKKDLLASTKAMTQFCKSRTEENFLKMIRLDHNKNLRTCLVNSNTFKQSFRYVQNNVSGVGAWVAKGEPTGPCGIVVLSRFEPEQPKGVSLVIWKYITRKAVMNPQGSFLPGASCKEFDEREYIYDWRSKEHQLSCDYIEFSAL